MTDLALIGDKNYLKRDPSSGSTSIAAPSAYTSWFMYATTYTVAHNLGYIPLARVYFENSATDGKVYPAGGVRNGLYPGLAYGTDCYCLYELDENNLTIYLESGTAQTGNRTIYWVIYKDF